MPDSKPDMVQSKLSASDWTRVVGVAGIGTVLEWWVSGPAGGLGTVGHLWVACLAPVGNGLPVPAACGLSFRCGLTNSLQQVFSEHRSECCGLALPPDCIALRNQCRGTLGVPMGCPLPPLPPLSLTQQHLPSPLPLPLLLNRFDFYS